MLARLPPRSSTRGLNPLRSSSAASQSAANFSLPGGLTVGSCHTFSQQSNRGLMIDRIHIHLLLEMGLAAHLPADGTQ